MSEIISAMDMKLYTDDAIKANIRAKEEKERMEKEKGRIEKEKERMEKDALRENAIRNINSVIGKAKNKGEYHAYVPEHLLAYLEEYKNTGYEIKPMGGTTSQMISWEKPAPPAQPEQLKKECCICMESECGACFHPCAHTDFCFACARDLKKCPICQTEGYAKPT